MSDAAELIERNGAGAREMQSVDLSGRQVLMKGTALKEGHFLGMSVSEGNEMKLRYFELARQQGVCSLVYFKSKDEASGVARGVIELDKAATVRRTKNVRDGFEYCIRIDAPNAANGANAAGAKRWTKLVMVLRNEPEMAAWIEAIQSGVAGGPVVAASRVLFEPPRQRTDSTVVFQGTALKEAHTMGLSLVDGSSMKLRFFVLKFQVGAPVLIYYKGQDEASGVARGVIALDKAATVRRTKNVRDGFEYCIRIDAPNAANGSGAYAAGVRAGAKRWTKMVMVLRNEPEMAAWIEAIRWILSVL